MAKKDYIPTSDNDKNVWLSNFANSLTTYASVLKISEEEVQSIKNDTAMYNYALMCLESVNAYNRQMTAFKNALRDGNEITQEVAMPLPPVFPTTPATVKAGIFSRIRKLAQNLKTREGYTEDIGKALGLVGESTVTDYNNLQPALQAEVSGGQVIVKWKKGKADSINIYVKRGTSDFTLAGTDAKPPYYDPTPLPAEATTWTYRAVYVVKDRETGKFSDEVSVLVKRFV